MRISPAIEKILEILQEGAENTVGVLDAFTSGYSESYRKLRRYKYHPPRFKTNWSSAYQGSQNFYALLYQLKKQGLIEKKKQHNGSLWKIKTAGIEKLNNIRTMKTFSVSSINYREEPDSLKIIAFDIPSKEDRKRHWLRAVLKTLGFTMLQKSVWIGKKKIPEDFLKDLKEKNMLEYVHIAGISKTGSLREIK